MFGTRTSSALNINSGRRVLAVVSLLRPRRPFSSQNSGAGGSNSSWSRKLISTPFLSRSSYAAIVASACGVAASLSAGASASGLFNTQNHLPKIVALLPHLNQWMKARIAEDHSHRQIVVGIDQESYLLAANHGLNRRRNEHDHDEDLIGDSNTGHIIPPTQRTLGSSNRYSSSEVVGGGGGCRAEGGSANRKPEEADLLQVQRELNHHVENFFYGAARTYPFLFDGRVVFENRTNGRIYQGLGVYSLLYNLFHIWINFRYNYITVEILDSQIDQEDLSVELRWTLKGLSMTKFLYLNTFKLRKKSIADHTDVVMEGISTYYIDDVPDPKTGKFKIIKHVIDNKDTIKPEKKSIAAEKLKALKNKVTDNLPQPSFIVKLPNQSSSPTTTATSSSHSTHTK